MLSRARQPRRLTGFSYAEKMFECESPFRDMKDNFNSSKTMPVQFERDEKRAQEC